MTSIRRYRPLRALVRISLISIAIGLPFIRVKGESALRFDIPSLTLHILGARIAMDEFFLVLVFILFLAFVILLVTILFGRIWCGWLCPQTVISDLTKFVDSGGGKASKDAVVAGAAVLPLSIVLAADILWYFVSPYDFFRQLMSLGLNAVVGWSWAVLTTATCLNFLFLRRSFCATVCPYAKMQNVLYDEQTMVIAMDPERRTECLGCDACARTCPVKIDVRKGIQTACINCAECIDACSDRLERLSKTSLIGYRFGPDGAGFSFARKGVLLSAVGAILFLAFLLYLALFRAKLEIVVVPDARSAPRITAEGRLVNMYVLTITNRTNADMTLSVRAGGPQGELLATPDTVHVPKNGRDRFLVAIRTSPREGPGSITISVTSRPGAGISAEQKVMMFTPQ